MSMIRAEAVILRLCRGWTKIALLNLSHLCCHWLPMNYTLLTTFCGDGSGWTGQFFERKGVDGHRQFF